MTRFLLSLTAVLFAGGIVLTGTVLFLAHQEIPEGTKGPEAEALRARIETATGQGAWKNVRALGFKNDTTNTAYFTVPGRNLVEVIFPEEADRVTVRYSDSGYRVYRNGELLDGYEARSLFETARFRFETDIFWLNPFRDLGNGRNRIEKIASRALLVRFDSHPDEAYLIVTDDVGLPTHWKMWKGLFSIGGQEAGFENWRELSKGAMVSLSRKGKFYEVAFSDPIVNFEDRDAADRFADLAGGEK